MSHHLKDLDFVITENTAVFSVSLKLWIINASFRFSEPQSAKVHFFK